jgi:hypothetical protein
VLCVCAQCKKGSGKENNENYSVMYEKKKSLLHPSLDSLDKIEKSLKQHEN